MIGSFSSHWVYTFDDIWFRLFQTPKEPPDDLFIELFRYANDYFKHELTVTEIDEIANDVNLATESFARLTGADFRNESAIVDFLENATEVTDEYEIEGFTDAYKSLVKDFVAKYNLRYRVVEPFQLRLLLTGTFASLYTDLERINSSNAHLAGLMDSFEHSFAHFARTRHTSDLRRAISEASIYAEGIAGLTAGKNDSLGSLIKVINTFPHRTIQVALSALYGFCSDYPGIRHAGNPDGVLRGLETRDALLVCLLIIVFSGYLTDSMNIEDIFEVLPA